MVLSDSAILQAVKEGKIVIDPFDRECLGSNSYDVHLSKHLSVYEDEILDSAKHNPLRYFEIPQSGYILLPGKLYLGSTLEYTETHGFYPELSGKSSTGRLGISIHLTAGNGDVGFSNYWTLEFSVMQPVRVYAGMPIGQMIYHTVLGEVERVYTNKPNAKFTQVDPKPMESAMYKNKFQPNKEDYRGIDEVLKEEKKDDRKQAPENTAGEDEHRPIQKAIFFG